MHCTQCGAEARGKFCATCGASLRSLPCKSCGSQIEAGTRFCTACGAPVGGGAPGKVGAPAEAGGGGGSRDVGWWVAGGLLLVVLIFVGLEAVGSNPEAPPAATQATAPFATSGTGTPPDLSTMTPREAADRLFNRVMSAAANENAQEADTFLPMAIDAYELARPLNADGLFHLALLQRAAGDLESSLATAEEGLESNPNHLLNLSAAAEAALGLGDPTGGVGYYQRMVDAWDEEIAAQRIEYEEHAPLLPLIREDAEAVLGGA